MPIYAKNTIVYYAEQKPIGWASKQLSRVCLAIAMRLLHVRKDVRISSEAVRSLDD